MEPIKVNFKKLLRQIENTSAKTESEETKLDNLYSELEDVYWKYFIKE